MNTLYVAGYFVFGVICFYLMMSEHAKTNRVTKSDLLGCFMFNLFVWPIGLLIIAYHHIDSFGDWVFKPILKHFNGKRR